MSDQDLRCSCTVIAEPVGATVTVKLLESSFTYGKFTDCWSNMAVEAAAQSKSMCLMKTSLDALNAEFGSVTGATLTVRFWTRRTTLRYRGKFVLQVNGKPNAAKLVADSKNRFFFSSPKFAMLSIDI